MQLWLEPRTERHFTVKPRLGGLFALPILLLFAAGAAAQLPPRLPPPPTPNFNPSSPLVVPQAPEVPVSPVAPGISPGSAPASGANTLTPSIIAEPAGKFDRGPRHYVVHHHRSVMRHGRHR
jgi:hypothetical protein